MIRIENLHYCYKDSSSFALNGIDLNISRGDFVALIGPNGCGKSTLARHLNCILSPTEGNLWVDDLNTREKENVWKIRKKVGMVFQNPEHQLIGNIVEEEVAFGPENICLERAEIIKRVNDSLRIVGLFDFKKKSVNMLSGGQKQKVAIASILAMQPECIVFDEPTTMLDPGTREEVFGAIKELNKEKNITIIYITHFMDEAARANRIIVLNDGRVKLDGPPSRIFSSVEALRDLSLDTPPMVGLTHELSLAGMDFSSFLLSPEELAEEIFKNLSVAR